ncbi:MAG: hypothetical protein ACOZQL_09885 [Myxococcota bacterium]
MTITTRQHKGKQIIYSDNTGLSSEKCIEHLEQMTKLILDAPGKVRLLTNFKDAAVGPEFMSRAKELGVKTLPKTERQAILGIDGLKMMLLKAYVKFTGADIKICQTEAEALDYLAS